MLFFSSGEAAQFVDFFRRPCKKLVRCYSLAMRTLQDNRPISRLTRVNSTGNKLESPLLFLYNEARVEVNGFIVGIGRLWNHLESTLQLTN